MAKQEDSGVSRIEEIRMLITKERVIFEALNRFNLSNNILQNYFWISKVKESEFISELRHLKKDNSAMKVDVFQANPHELRLKPPTLIRTDDFSMPFQEIVNTYGHPRYQEMNPGAFTIVTFPYEFGIMFGDIGHGGIILAVGYCLIHFYDQIYKTKLRPVLQLRYLIFLMGFFATFCGFIYNDFLAIPWNVLGSCYRRHGLRFERKSEECVPWVGIDPLWYQAANEVSFMNSFKMKLSIVVGVVHMILGICLKIMNTIYFRKMVDLLCEAIPQLIFFLCTFGYMVFCIVLKWLIDWGDGSKAPSIIAIFINLGKTQPGEVLFGDPQGIQQTSVQYFLFTLAFVSVFWMFFPKPLILGFQIYLAQRRAPAHPDPLHEQLIDPKEKTAPAIHAPSDEHEEIGEIFVH